MRSLNDIIIEGLADWCTKFTEEDVKKYQMWKVKYIVKKNKPLS